MMPFKRFFSFSKRSIVNRLLFSLLIIGCLALGISCDSSSSNDSSTGQPSGEVQEGAFLALAATPEDQPVANATIAGLGTTTSSYGVATGSSTPEMDKWYKVQAVGHAPDYVRSLGRLEGRALFESTLTPVDSRETYSYGSAAVISDNAAGPFVEISVPPDVFTGDGLLELTRIEPLHLGPLFAETASGEPLYPQMAFSIEAWDENRNEAAFQAGTSATLTLTDNGRLGDSPVLAWFNPESGKWEELDAAAYRRTNENTIEATLTHFSTYAGMGSSPPRGQGYAGAKADLQQSVNDWAQEDGGGVPPQEVLDALDRLAQEAMNFAEAHPDEVGKQRLFSVMAQAQLLGQDSVSQEMLDKARDITQGIAEALINSPNCGRLREMLGCMAQCQMLGLFSLADDLYAKIQDLINVCNNWHGTVNFIMDIQDPSDMDPDYVKTSGPSTWTELHEIVLSVNPEDYNITGDDLVTVVAPEVVYRAPADAGDCQGDAYDELIHKAAPAIGDLFLTIDGVFQPGERPGFTLETPEKGAGSNSVALSFAQYSQWYEGECRLETLGPEEVEFPYHSLLVDQNPPITLEQMLNTGFYFDHEEAEIIKGCKKVSLDGSTFGMWPLPFNRLAVQWHFVHVKPDLE